MTTNQKATGSNPVGCTTKTLDELRAVEGFSFAVLKQFFLILLDFFEFDQPQRVLLSRRRAAAFFALEPVDSGSFDKNGRFGTNHGTKPIRGDAIFSLCCQCCNFPFGAATVVRSGDEDVV